MTKIHHATRKKAESLAILLDVAASGAIKATHTPTSITAWNDDPKIALSQVSEMVTEHEKGKWYVTQTEEGKDFGAKIIGAKEFSVFDPDLDDLFISVDELGVNPEEEDEDEEDRGSVVPARYKQEYAERNNGDASHCGDWLAVTLNSYCRIPGGKGQRTTTDLDRLESIAVANGADAKRIAGYNRTTPGWEGRLRMTIRNILTKLVAGQGFLFIPEGCGEDSDTELKAPKNWCKLNAPKIKEKA